MSSLIRIINRVLVVVLATGVMITSVAIVVESVAHLVDQGPLLLPLEGWKEWLLDRRWSDDVVTAIAASIGVGGLLLLIAETWPRRPVAYVMNNPADATETRRYTLGRNGLENRIAHMVETEHPVLAASARARRKSVKVDIAVPPSGTDSIRALRAEIHSAVKNELAALPLSKQMRVKVNMRRAKERVT